MTVTNFIWDELSDNVLMETDENNVPTVVYNHRPERFGELISQERSGVTSYYLYDGAHSTRLLTDDNGEITDTYIFSAFGELVARTGTTFNPFGYKGAVGYYTNTATNDIYVRARTYEPVIGRWLSMDPLGFVDGPNLYRAYFVPMGADPSGQEFRADDFGPFGLNPAWWYHQSDVTDQDNWDKWPCKPRRPSSYSLKSRSCNVGLDSCCELEVTISIRARRCFRPGYEDEHVKDPKELSNHFFTEIVFEKTITRRLSETCPPGEGRETKTESVVCRKFPGRYISKLIPDFEGFELPDCASGTLDDIQSAAGKSACKLVEETEAGIPGN